MFDQYSVAVFTTPERCDLFRAALGDEVDYRLHPYASVPFDTTLENLHAGGAQVVVVDESHFFAMQHLKDGLRTYLDKRSNRGKLLRIVLVCPKRSKGDAQLAFFAGYLGIYDIVYDVQGVETVDALTRILQHPNERVDVLELIASAWPDTGGKETEHVAGVLGTGVAVGTLGAHASSFHIPADALGAQGFEVRVNVSIEPSAKTS